MNRIFSGMLAMALSGCAAETPKPPPSQPQVIYQMSAPTSPATSPATSPVQEAPPLPPVQPGTYVNHVGNPAHGSWGPDGQWVWKDPESKEANDTWKYLAAAGAGAAGGAALSMLLSKRHFEQRNPGGQWLPENNSHTEMSYRDKRGNPISREEYERRKAQSERDRARYWEKQKAKVQAEREQVKRERAELERQKQQQKQVTPRSQPKHKRYKPHRRRRK